MPGRLVIPLRQHRGPSATPLVEVGQDVSKGQVIGEAPEGGAHVHAPTSGQVVAIEERPMAHASGQPGLCVMVDPDGEDRWAPMHPLPDWRERAPASLLDHIRSAGVVGLGGAVFPTDLKARMDEREAPHTLILNGAECEPYIACDDMLMREAADRILLGAQILRRAVGAKRVLVALEEPMEHARAALRAAAETLGDEAPAIVAVPARYPEGGERQLIETLTGQRVPDGGLPRDIGLLVQNVATAAAVHDAVVLGAPLLERVVTITGNGVNDPRNVLALIGTPVEDLVAAAGGYTDTVSRLVVGGPMMGYPLSNDAEPVVKATNCLLALDEDDVRPTQVEMPCIRCSDCAPVCPERLLPQELLFQARAGQWDDMRDLRLESCIECGCCDHVCPSHIPLTQWFRFAKGELDRLGEERAAARHAKARFDAREARLERKAEEKAERLAQRKQKLADQAGRKRQIQAALDRARQKNDGGEA